MIPDSVRLSFYFGAAVFFLAVLWTVLRSKEYAPEEMASFRENQAREAVAVERRTPQEFAVNGGRQIRLGSDSPRDRRAAQRLAGPRARSTR